MAFSRINLIAGFLLLHPALALATGGNYDEAPPTLDYYLQRLPAKSISQIMDESGVTAPTGTKPVIDRTELLHDFAAGPSPALVKKIDQLIEKARVNYSSPTEINLLQDFRDLAGGKGTAAETGAYVKWRLDHLDWYASFSGSPWEKPKPDAGRPAEMDAKIKASSPALLPHWLYLKGALYYKDGNDTDSETYFNRVLTKYPDSARAETALFMKARCRLSQSVEGYDAPPPATPKDYDAIRKQARQLFLDYLAKYPKGRYRNDVAGWLGGAAYRSDDFAGALPYFIQQTEAKDHPEDFRPTIVMIEKCLYHLRDSNSTDIDQIAQHPSVALALAYFAINSAKPKDYDNGDEIVNVQKWRHAVLPKLATAVLAHKKLYEGKIGQDRYLAILAHAASDQGNQEQALELIRLSDKAQDNDDLAFARALVLQRAGKLDDAVDAYRRFLDRFPDSSLVRGARYRLALALHDQKKEGEALLEFAALRNNHLPLRAMPQPVTPPSDQVTPDADTDTAPVNSISAIDIDYSGASDQQIDQTMDALLNFAPIKSLETALKGNDKEHAEFRNDLRQVLQERSLAREDYAGAAGFADSPDLKKKFHALAEQTDGVQKAAGPEAAKESMQLADYWATQAKMLVAFPLDGTDARSYLFEDEGLVASSQRKINGTALSYAEMDQELEDRNELQHAIKWWMKTAEADDKSELAPQALWKVLQSQRKMVETSPYTQQRAVEIDLVAKTRKVYDTLTTKYPDSTEVKKYAVYWTFPNKQELLAAGQYYSYAHLAFTRDSGEIDTPGQDDRYSNSQEWSDIGKKIAALPDTTKDMDAAAFDAEIKAELAKARPYASCMERMAMINFLEDLQLLAQVTPLDPAIRHEYLNLRLQVLRTSINADESGLWANGYPDDKDLDDEKLKKDIIDFGKKAGTESIHDFIAFLNLAVIANHLVDVPATGLEKDGQPTTYSSRDFPLLAKEAAAFLKQYPKSPKREAAAVLQLRGMALAARPRRFEHSIDWPAANSWNGDSDPQFFQQAALDAPVFEGALKAYADEFPQGHYPNAVLSYRADVELVQNRWGEALDDLMTLREQKTAPEFQVDAAIGLSSLFDKLDDNELRYPILQEILKRPAVREQLQSYIQKGGIPYLRDYFLERLKKP